MSPAPVTTPVAVLGLGIIGATWARNLAADGIVVRTWNRSPRPDAPGWCADPAAAVRGVGTVIVVVADPPAVEQVLAAAAPGFGAGQVVVQSSTISARWTKRFAERVQGAGAELLDAPFTGSKPAAEARQVVFYCGGPAALLDRARPVLDRLAKAVLHVGPVGAASSLKLAMNVNIALVAQALCESRAIARKAGIGDATYFEALKLNASRSGVADLKEPKLRADDWSPQFSVKHLHKDLRLALEEARGLRLPMTEQITALHAEALAAGWGDDDFISLARLVR